MPTPRTPLVGRASEIAAARLLLLDEVVPQLTVTGPGGVGKTRLALAIAHDLADAFVDGVVFVDLAPIRDAGLVLEAISHAVGIRDAGGRPPAEVLFAVLKTQQLLVLLDNCEQVLNAAPDIAALLAACPAVQILATSRAPIRIRGEHLLLVHPLRLPAIVGGERSSAVAERAIRESDAVTLFVQRAVAVDPTFALSTENAGMVAEICVQLDGLPLALELAAARLRARSLVSLMPRVSDRWRLLSRGGADVPERQRTLRDTIAWSVDLLEAAERAVFRRLAIFVGGFEAGAVSAVAGLDERDARDALEILVEHSLVVREERGDGPERCHLFESIRVFGLEELAASGEEPAVRARHATWYLNEVEDAWQPRAAGPAHAHSLRRLNDERDNVRAALSWFITDNQTDNAQRLAGALAEYWWFQGAFSEGRAWLARVLAMDDGSPALRAAVLYGAAALAEYQGDLEEARAAAAESLELANVHGDRLDRLRARFLVGQVASFLGEPEHAAVCAATTLSDAQTLGDPIWLAYATNQVASVSHILGASAEALAGYERADALFAAVEDRWGRTNGTRYRAAAHRALGDRRQSAALYREGLDDSRNGGLRWGVVECVIGLAALAAEIGAGDVAARFLGAADTLRLPMGSILDPIFASEQHVAMALACGQLGEQPFAEAMSAGNDLATTNSFAEARAFADTIARTDALPNHVSNAAPVDSTTRSGAERGARSASDHGPPLSPRERDVLGLLTLRLSDKEIAEQLSISPRTVMTHVSNIFNKLGVTNRRQAVARAARDGPG